MGFNAPPPVPSLEIAPQSQQEQQYAEDDHDHSSLKRKRVSSPLLLDEEFDFLEEEEPCQRHLDSSMRDTNTAKIFEIQEKEKGSDASSLNKNTIPTVSESLLPEGAGLLPMPLTEEAPFHPMVSLSECMQSTMESLSKLPLLYFPTAFEEMDIHADIPTPCFQGVQEQLVEHLENGPEMEIQLAISELPGTETQGLASE